MAKISIAIQNPTKETELISQVFVRMVEQLLPLMFTAKDYPEKLPLEVRKSLAEEVASKSHWKIVHNGKEWYIDGPGIHITRLLYADDRLPNGGVLVHKFFEISSNLQSKKLSSVVMKASLELSDITGYKTVDLMANLDVGGYAWFRKGAVPYKGKKEIIDIAEGYQVKSADKRKLVYSFLDEFEDLPDGEWEKYLLSPQFSKYKEMFLGSTWQGKFDLNNPATRIAMIEGADAAFDFLTKQQTTPETVLTSNEEIRNELIKNQVRSIAFSTGLVKQRYEVLKATEEKIELLLLKYGSKFAGITDLRSAKARSLFRLLEKDLLAARQEAWVKITAELTAEMQTYAAGQAVVIGKVVTGAVPVALNLNLLSAPVLASIVNATPFEGRVLKDWLKRTENLDHARITKEAVRGITQGLTTGELVRSIIGDPKLKNVDGFTRKSFKDLEALILTVTSGIQNEVRSEVYKQNSDVFDEEYFVATLDMKTTFICAGNDGKRFKIGTGPMPPLHFRCRSLRAPYINPEAMFERPYKSAYEKQLLNEYGQKRGLLGLKTLEDLPRGLKTDYLNFARLRTREMVGQLPATTNFTTFLKAQSKDFQDEYLGKARAEAFRRGDFSLNDFTNSSGRTYTNTELGLSV